MSKLKKKELEKFNNSDGVLLEGIPLPPEGLTRRQKKFWNSQVPVMYRMKMLSETDMPQLLNLVEAYEVLETCKDNIKTIQKDYKKDFGEEYLKMYGKASSLYFQASQNYNKLASLFGMTPVDRRYLPTQIGTDILPSEGANPLELLGIKVEADE